MADAKFARARSWEEMIAIHRTWMRDYTVQLSPGKGFAPSKAWFNCRCSIHSQKQRRLGPMKEGAHHTHAPISISCRSEPLSKRANHEHRHEHAWVNRSPSGFFHRYVVNRSFFWPISRGLALDKN